MVGPRIHLPIQSRGIRRRLAAAITSAALIAGMCVAPVQGVTTFAIGDVFVAVGSSSVQWRQPNGTLVTTLDDTSGSAFTTGMAFDSSGNLYVTDFAAASVSKFDNTGTLLGTFGSGYGTPESILFDAAGNAYVGDLSAGILKFDSSGALLHQFSIGRVDWIDLSADQCTMLYTQEGGSIHRYDVCADTALSDFTINGGDFALRILKDGTVLVADNAQIDHFDASGNLLGSYDAPNEDSWFALNLDPDGVSFWSADFSTSDVYRFNIATGTVISSFNTGTLPQTVFGLSVFGEITASQTNSAVSYTGPASVQYSDSLTLSGHLQTSPGGLPIAGENLGFVLGTDTKSAGPTDSLGNASAAPYQELQKPGSATSVTVSFAGDASTNPKLGPSSSTADFTILKEDCTVAYTGDILVNAANPTTLSAQFGELDASHGDWSNKLITFTVTDAALNTYGPFTATTDSSGLASTTANLGPNVYSVSVSFAGDDYYLSCASAADTLVTVQAANAKITGGGWISQGTGKTNFGFNVIRDVIGLNGQLQVRVRSGKDKFHSTSVLTLNSSGNSGTWTGTGRWNGVTGYSFTVSVVDNGTSGKKGDTISIVIKSPTNVTVFTTGGAQPLKGGNIVVH